MYIKANSLPFHELEEWDLLDLERILRKIIAFRFKKLRGDTPYELISSQRGNINRIEQGINTSSGNFVSDTLLDEYSKYFGKSKAELIFGDDGQIENTLFALYHFLRFKKRISSSNKTI